MRAAAMLALALLAGCKAAGPAHIDGRSAESFERTTGQARNDLPNADRLIFDRALRTIGGRRFANRDPQALARVTFDQMTAAEVVADQRAREH